MPRFEPVEPSVDLPRLEESVLERWRRHGVFEESIRRRRGAPRFVFYEGPPTANGRPGSHHVLSRVFKDVFPRYKTMRGYLVERKAGWDCHGLPVELEIERELGLSSKQEIERFGIAEFNKRCRESVFKYIEDWNRLTERIGFWIDLDDAYATLTNDYIESVWWSLRQVFDKGLLYEGHKVVPYCPRCGTALSSHEVALGYREVSDPSVYVRFPLVDEPGTSLLGWTTTPWTLLSNAALAVNPQVEYARVRYRGEQLILAAELVERVLGEDAEVIERMPGSALVGRRYRPPFDFITDWGPHGHTVLPADFVTVEEGTGVVHTAVAFGEDDFRLGQEYGLPVHNPVREDGTFDERMGQFAGLFVKDADPRIIEALRESGRLLRAEEIVHSYPHCWRCDTPLLYYAKTSWYVRTTAVRERMLEENERVRWYPEHIKHGRFGNWLANNVDWALSRERYWGTPLPIWRCGEGHLHCVGSIAELRELAGAVPDDLHKPYIDEVVFPCPQCGGSMRRVPEVIDAWWDSGAMPFAQWHFPFENRERFEQNFPADYISEAIDQTRGWFYSLLAVSTLLFDRSPYRTVLCLGLILDEQGQKMSKSRGNVVDPWDVIGSFGADAFRWYYFTAKQPWDGYRFSLETVGEATRPFLRTLWSTYHFFVLYANLAEQELPELDEVALAPLDRWLLSRLAGLCERVIERMDDYDTTSAGRAIADFVDELSNWYVRLTRRRFWDGEPAALATLRHVLVELAKLIAPFTPFLADAIYTNLDGRETSVHLCDFPQPGARDRELEWQIDVVREVVELGRAARAQAGVKLRQPLREAAVLAPGRERAAIERFEDLVRDELNVKSVRYVEAAEQLGRVAIKPNWRRLGPRFGPRMPRLAEAIAALPGAEVASRLRAGEPVTIELEGERIELGPDDLQVVLEPLEGYQVERSGTHAVGVDLEIDEALRREGLARELVHAIQNARKEAGLRVEDRIRLALAGDDELLAVARQFEREIARETLALEVAYGADRTERRFQARVDGREIVIGLEPASS
ncbi:isoleucine--tRNA ligase [Thermoleophilum album]|uniref:Isoleucine--tRNA ligase n=1 Tax=Thermoleophilum album TaxID=29539 RepID=A0A1H6FKI8_THEAL|nr:isoleucine--tRNA ligase [Thermoleophilum album]SEH11377.1 Isoleucyl-tRNA synthetase [Thermoleophilum album]